MTLAFQKATKKAARLRMALIGPSGSGKTFSALRIAAGFGGRVGVIDTERGSASKYADRFAFEVLELETFHPERYVEAIREAEKAGIEVLIIDSLSHAWTGKDGALEQVDNAAKRQKGNSFGAWREVTPMHNALVDAILRSRCHIIATMRSKTEYVVEQGPNGKQVPRKVGLAPVQRDGMEYEFDVVGDMDGAALVVTKTRCSDLAEKVLSKPGEDLGRQLRQWLTDGAAPAGPANDNTQASTPVSASDGKPTGPQKETKGRAAKRLTLEEASAKDRTNEPVGFGRFKSLMISGADESLKGVEWLDDVQLGEAMTEGEDIIKKNPEHWSVPALQNRLMLLDLEYEAREKRAAAAMRGEASS